MKSGNFEMDIEWQPCTSQKWGSHVNALSGGQMSRNGEADCQSRTASTELTLP